MLPQDRPPKKAFLLVADLERKSDALTRRVLRTATTQLGQLNYSCEITDCVNEGWDQPISTADFVEVSDPIHVSFRAEQMISKAIPKIENEQRKLKSSDLFMIITTLGPFGPPSVFWNWVQRVLQIGKMVSAEEFYKKGFGQGHDALVVTVSSLPATAYGRDSFRGQVEEALYPITHGILLPCGFKIRRSQALFFPNPIAVDDVLSKWGVAVREVEERTPMVLNDLAAYVNWGLAGAEKDRRSDFDLLSKAGDMTLAEATMRLTGPPPEPSA